MKRSLTLTAFCLCLVAGGHAQFLINQTGFVNPNTGKLQSTPPPELTGGLTGSQLDNTGFVGDANLGQRINYSDGGWFQGIVRYGRRESGRLHHPDGTEDVGSFDANGYLHGLCATIWTNGVWYYGYHQNGQRHGDGSLYMNGCYYDQSYSYGTLISSVQVSSPRYNWPERERMISDAKASASGYSSNNNSGGASNYQPSRTVGVGNHYCRNCCGKGYCPLCSGNGMYRPYIGAPLIRCGECGGNGKHRLCNGTGRY